IRPIVIKPSVMVNEVGLVILSSLALLAIGCSDLLGDTGPRIVSRTSGILLLLFFVIFLRYTLAQVNDGRASEDSGVSVPAKKEMPLWRAVAMVLVGLGGLVIGGDRFVAGASGVALSLGMSEAVVGLTIVAAGTSLPELAASAAAAMKGNSGIAVGNVIGSNIFNIFLVLGVTSTISPLPFGGSSHFDLAVRMLASLLFWFFCWKIGKRTITRPEGGILVAAYIAYIVYQVFAVTA
ncbi:MAG: sodium:calcium antiporter, partial [Muribaculaceae bacterium]|nr:sodium:calcium antiporter [Muribaculaceae bacterium]